MAAYLARVGTVPEDRPLLERDIQELKCTQDGVYVRGVGHKHGWSKFWHKYKKAIIITAIFVAVVATVTVIALCAGGAGAASSRGRSHRFGMQIKGKRAVPSSYR